MKRHAPILVWLLLAATLAVDVVGYSRVEKQPGPTLAVVGFDALMVGQLSVACIWSALAARTVFGAIVVPAFGIAATVLAISCSGLTWQSMLPYYALHVALLWSALKLLERTPYWQRWSGRTTRWRFSVFQLLVVMTVVAVLTASTGQSQFFRRGGGWLNLAFMAGSLCLALVAVVCWSLPIHWLLRLAGVLACAVAFGGAFTLLGDTLFALYFSFHYLIQALVLSAWLGCGPILSRDETAFDKAPLTRAKPNCTE